MPEIYLIIHNIRSAHNVGSLLRTAECFGVKKIYFTGYTPYPYENGDTRLPHIYTKLSKQISKTALGAESIIQWSHRDLVWVLNKLKKNHIPLIGLEQSAHSVPLDIFMPPQKLGLVIGNEIEGVEPSILDRCSYTLEITQYGMKESLNVAQATAIALYHLTTVK